MGTGGRLIKLEWKWHRAGWGAPRWLGWAPGFPHSRLCCRTGSPIRSFKVLVRGLPPDLDAGCWQIFRSSPSNSEELPNSSTSATDECFPNFNEPRNLPETRQDADSASAGLGWGPGSCILTRPGDATGGLWISFRRKTTENGKPPETSV